LAPGAPQMPAGQVTVVAAGGVSFGSDSLACGSASINSSRWLVSPAGVTAQTSYRPRGTSPAAYASISISPACGAPTSLAVSLSLDVLTAVTPASSLPVIFNRLATPR